VEVSTSWLALNRRWRRVKPELGGGRCFVPRPFRVHPWISPVRWIRFVRP
jgi:hypothetical protein